MQLEATVAASHARATVLVWELRSLQQFSLCAFAMAHEQIERFCEKFWNAEDYTQIILHGTD